MPDPSPDCETCAGFGHLADGTCCTACAGSGQSTLHRFEQRRNIFDELVRVALSLPDEDMRRLIEYGKGLASW